MAAGRTVGAVTTTPTVRTTEAAYRRPELPVPLRVGDLLTRMTLEEKVAQLAALWLNETDDDYAGFTGGRAVERIAALAPYGIGGLTRVYGSGPMPTPDALRVVNEVQRWLVEETRLGIPALVHEECLTGLMAPGATVVPSPLGWGASFDPDLVERVGAMIGAQMRTLGVHQGLAPVLDVPRDQRWGRVEECIGEDPWLVGVVGAAYVRGLQSAGVAATGKHFAGHAAGEAGHNTAPVHAGRRELADVHLLPFELAMRAGLQSVMSAYHDLDGVPTSADPWLLTELLRDRWGFTGVVVSDYWALDLLVGTHRVAASYADAGAAGLRAGVDMELPNPRCYADLADAVRAGTVDEALVDRAVRRVLELKIGLSLLDEPYAAPARGHLDTTTARALAGEAAAASLVLLQNRDGVLPLEPDVQTVAVIGANADDPRALLGNYTFRNHVAYRFPEVTPKPDVQSVLDAIRQRAASTTTVLSHPGVPLTAADGDADLVEQRLASAARIAAEADVAVVVVGDRAGHFGRGTVGEGTDRDSLSLPGEQERLVEVVAATGTPTVVVLTSGRAHRLDVVADRAQAVLQAWFPGEQGGAAIAAALFGDASPGGRTPLTFGGDAGRQPAHYGGGPPLRQDYLDSPVSPVFPFGHGLSYTTFTYSDLEHDAAVPTDGRIRAACTVRNTGERTGDEVVQLYVRDDVASVVRPEIELRAFRRLRLRPGEAARVDFVLPTDVLAFTGADLRRVVEPGTVQLLVGASSADIRLRGTVTLTGAVRVVGDDRDLAWIARAEPLPR